MLWSLLRMEGYGGPAQPSPTITQCLNGGLAWLEVECKRCKTRASLPLDAIRRPRDTPIWKLEATCIGGKPHRPARKGGQSRSARSAPYPCPPRPETSCPSPKVLSRFTERLVAARTWALRRGKLCDHVH